MLIRRLLTLAVLPFVSPVAAWAQGAPAGVVTRLEGNVTAARASLPQPVALKFKDGVFVNDRIVTGDQSIVRLLLGGKAVVTVRERSSLTITEVPGRSTMNLESGKIALAVARERMRAGDSIEIRTPNAVAGIRGTVVIAEYKETTAQLGALGGRGGLTTFFGLRGTFEAIFGTQSFVVGAGQFAAGGAASARTGTMTAEMLAAALSGLQVPTAEVADGGQNSAKDQALGTTVATFGQQLASIQSNVGPRVDNLIDTNRPAPNPLQPVWLPGGGQSNLAAEASTILSTTLGPSRSPVTPPVPGHTITPNSIDRSAGPFNSPPFGSLVANGLVTDQYKSLGVVFGLPSVRVGIFLDFDGVPAWAGVNGSNTLDLVSPVQGHFVVPGTPTPATTNAVSVEIGSASVGSLVLEVFNQSGTRVGFSLNDDGTGPHGRTLAKVSAPGIASFIVSGGDTWGMDQLSWGDTVDPPAVLTLGGPLFRATNEQRSAFTTFLNIFDETIVGQSTDPLVWLEASRIATAHNFARLTNADVTAAGAFLRLENGSEIVQTGSTDPLVLMMGGSLRVGTDAAPGSLFELMGRTGFTLADPDPDPVTGAPTGLVLGTDRPLQPVAGAPVFQADAGAVVAVRGSLYKADTALLEATAPLLLVTGNSTVTTGSHAVDLTNRAKVAIPNDAVAMLNVERGTLNVLNGHLVNVAGGSRLNLGGDLLRIGSGGTVNIFNGALLNVSGASVASIDGALVRFTGSGGVLNVSNTLAPTTFLGGVPIYVASGATANLSLGTGALSGLNLGTIRINNAVLPANAGPGSVTGSLITVQGAGGSVRVGRN